MRHVQIYRNASIIMFIMIVMIKATELADSRLQTLSWWIYIFSVWLERYILHEDSVWEITDGNPFWCICKKISRSLPPGACECSLDTSHMCRKLDRQGVNIAFLRTLLYIVSLLTLLQTHLKHCVQSTRLKLRPLCVNYSNFPL